MEMGILQTLILPLLFGEQVLNIPSQSPAAIILIVAFVLLMNICMTRQHLQNGAFMALKGWMLIKQILHRSWLSNLFSRVFSLYNTFKFFTLICWLIFLAVNSSWSAMSCKLGWKFTPWLHRHDKGIVNWFEGGFLVFGLKDVKYVIPYIFASVCIFYLISSAGSTRL